MHFYSLHYNSLMRGHGAYVLASSAAYADILMNVRYIQAVFKFAERNHLDCLYRAMFRAGCAVGTVGFYNA